MKHLSFTTTVMAIAALALAGTRPALAQFTLDARYTGTVTDVIDTYGLFGSVAPGDFVSGVIQYNAAVNPYFAGPTEAGYNFPVAPGNGNVMTASVGMLNTSATQSLTVVTYNDRFVFGPNLNIYGYSFQFNDGDNSLLNTSGLPSGYTIDAISVDVGLVATTPLPFDFPDPPSALLPIENYYPLLSTGDFAVDIFDANGNYMDTSIFEFSLNSTQNAVPEPGSVALLVGMSVAGAGFLVRRRKRK